MDDALAACKRDIKDWKGPQPAVPMHLRNAPTKLMKDLNYGKGYNMAHKDVSGLQYMPDGMEDRYYFDWETKIQSHLRPMLPISSWYYCDS